MPISTISTKGQITLPARLRKQLGMKPRDRVAIDVIEDAIVIKRAVSFFELRGFLGKSLPPDEARKRMEEGVAKHVMDTQQ
jgi:AbrB family looped-hinge helix DNA binding protein